MHLCSVQTGLLVSQMPTFIFLRLNSPSLRLKMERAAYITPKMRLLGEKEAWAWAKLPPSAATIGLSTKTHGRAFTSFWTEVEIVFAVQSWTQRRRQKEKQCFVPPKCMCAHTRIRTPASRAFWRASKHLLQLRMERQTRKWSETSLICVESDLATPNVRTSKTQWDLKRTHCTMTRSWINLISLDIQWHTYSTISPLWYSSILLHSKTAFNSESLSGFWCPFFFVSTTTSIMLKEISQLSGVCIHIVQPHQITSEARCGASGGTRC